MSATCKGIRILVDTIPSWGSDGNVYEYQHCDCQNRVTRLREALRFVETYPCACDGCAKARAALVEEEKEKKNGNI